MEKYSFFGRQNELQILNKEVDKKNARLIVMRGRRRIGKSRLIEEFIQSNQLKAYTFSGILPVKGTTRKMQLEEFARQMGRNGLPRVVAEDWGDLFWTLASHTSRGPVVIVLDEISWMGTKDIEFLSKLKNAWDSHFKNNPDLILILCGSVSSWIEEEILNNPAFLGRISLKMVIRELPLHECNQFWKTGKGKISAFDKFKLLSVTGGVPRYLEEVDTSVSAEENIRHLCFSEEGFLFDEFDKIFSDLFGRKSAGYKRVVSTLVQGAKSQADIFRQLKVSRGSKVSQFLHELTLAGFLQRDYTWQIDKMATSGLSRYRLSDNYLRFYLKWIEPNHRKVEQGDFAQRSLSSMPNWDGIMGLQFENLILNNRKSILSQLGLLPDNIACHGPYFQTQTKQRSGCQIDYMIQTEQSFLYVCEIKFSKRPLGIKVIKEVQEKIQKLETPKHFSVLPVLIHVGPLSPALVNTNYFVKTIDCFELLNR